MTEEWRIGSLLIVLYSYECAYPCCGLRNASLSSYLNKAKPLLSVGGKPIIEWILDNLADVPDLETVYIVTNDKFLGTFKPGLTAINIDNRNQNSKSSTTAPKAMTISWARLRYQFRCYPENLTKSDLLIVAGDNLLKSLAGFVACAKKSEATAVYDVGDKEAIKNYGNIAIDADGIITHFEEKPEKPRAPWLRSPYYYSPEVLSLLTTYLAAGNNPDQPGRFVQWLYTRKPVKTFQITGKWLDIGSKETLEKANKIFAKLAP
jgi:glucose-1-phosphate thymidylyltransferase